MKKLTLLIAIFCFSFQTQAQKFIGSFIVKKVSFSTGSDSDRVHGLSSTYFTNQIDDSNFQLRDMQFDQQDLISGVCENPNVRLGLTLGIPGVDRIEWNNTLVWMPNRVDGITYYDNYTGGESNYLTFNQTQNEIALETSINYNIIDRRVFRLYGGFGTNAGVTYNNSIYAYGSTNSTIEDVTFDTSEEIFRDFEQDGFYTQHYNTKSDYNQRVFWQAGFGFTILKKVEVGFDFKRGLGVRVAQEAPTQFTKLISSGMSINYIF